MATSTPLGKTGRCASREQVSNQPVPSAQQAMAYSAPLRLRRDKISTAVFPTGPWALKLKVGCGARSPSRNFRGLPPLPMNRFQLTCASLGKLARAFGIDQSLTNAATGSSSSFNETFGTAYAGGGFKILFDTREVLGFIKRFDVDVGIEAGPVWPGDGGLFMQINATGTAWLNNNVGVYFGYENLRQNVNTNDYELNSYIGGLIMGLSVKF